MRGDSTVVFSVCTGIATFALGIAAADTEITVRALEQLSEIFSSFLTSVITGVVASFIVAAFTTNAQAFYQVRGDAIQAYFSNRWGHISVDMYRGNLLALDDLEQLLVYAAVLERSSQTLNRIGQSPCGDRLFSLAEQIRDLHTHGNDCGLTQVDRKKAYEALGGIHKFNRFEAVDIRPNICAFFNLKTLTKDVYLSR